MSSKTSLMRFLKRWSGWELDRAIKDYTDAINARTEAMRALRESKGAR